MTNFTNPIETTFELQRRSLEQGQQAIEQSLAFQRQVGDSIVKGIDSQEQMQRRFVELHRDTVYSTLDAIEGLPGADVAADDLRASIDDGYEELLSGHEEAFDAIGEELETGIDSSNEVVDDLVDTLEEQLDLIVDAHEELEAQSVEATEEFSEQVEELQEQADEVQEQIQKVSEEAADAVDA